MIDVDFSGVERGGPLPAGDYVCVISDSQCKPSAKGDSQNLWISLEVESPAEFSGRPIRNRVLTLHPNALKYSFPDGTHRFFEAVLNMEVTGKLPFNDEEVLVGEKIGVTLNQVEDENDSTKIYNNVVAWWHPSSKEDNPFQPTPLETGV